MVLAGRANWYLPAWLDRVLPNINIEGAGFFDERDRRGEPEALAGPLQA